jgi:hypothetical protein
MDWPCEIDRFDPCYQCTEQSDICQSVVKNALFSLVAAETRSVFRGLLL